MHSDLVIRHSSVGLSCTAYLIEVLLFVLCFRATWTNNKRSYRDKCMLVFLALLFAMNTVWTVDNVVISYCHLSETVRYGLSKTIVVLGCLTMVFNEFLLLWRCFVIWTLAMPTTYKSAMILPIALFITTSLMMVPFVMNKSIYSLEGHSATERPLFNSLHFGLSLMLNIVMTSMIVGRMWMHAHKVKKTLGACYTRPYVTISAMFMESAALYTIDAVLLTAAIALKHPTSDIWLHLSPSIQTIASYLIILRLANNNIWSTCTSAEYDPHLDSIVFAASVDDPQTRTQV